jgi:ATP-dependent Lhr-like helicase
VTTAVFVRFLFAWQRVAPDQRQLGQASLPAILAQLEGFEAAAGAWESALLPARVADYDPLWLDGLCLSGQWVWGRAEPPTSSKALRSLATTPIVLGQRENWSWLVNAGTPSSAARAAEPESEPLELSALGRQIEEQLRRTGPRFFHDLRRACRPARSWSWPCRSWWRPGASAPTASAACAACCRTNGASARDGACNVASPRGSRAPVAGRC